MADDLEHLKTHLHQLERAKTQLEKELRQMSKAQGNLYRFQERIEKQKTIYAQIAQVGNRFNESLSFEEILSGLDRFTLDLLNFDKYALVLPLIEASSGDIHWKLERHGGFRNPEERNLLPRVSATLTSHKDKTFQESLGDQVILVVTPELLPLMGESVLEVSKLFGLHEFYLIRLGSEASGGDGFLVVGNAERNLEVCQRVENSEEFKALFLNFSSMVTGSLVTQSFIHRVQEESQRVSRLLNNMQQAVFSVRADGRIVEPVSLYTKSLFGQGLEGLDIFETVFKDISKKSEVYSLLKTGFLTVFGEDAFQWELAEDSFPKKFHYFLTSSGSLQEKTLRSQVRPFFNEEGLLESIMFVIEDVTELERLERQISKEKEEIQIVQEVVKNSVSDMKSFFERSQKLIGESFQLSKVVSESPEALGTVFRNFHTLKGNSRLFGFSFVSRDIHLLEDQILKSKESYAGGTLSVEELAKEIQDHVYNLYARFLQYAEVTERVFSVQLSFKNFLYENLHRALLVLENPAGEEETLSWRMEFFRGAKILADLRISSLAQTLIRLQVENQQVPAEAEKNILELVKFDLFKSNFFKGWSKISGASLGPWEVLRFWTQTPESIGEEDVLKISELVKAFENPQLSTLAGALKRSLESKTQVFEEVFCLLKLNLFIQTAFGLSPEQRQRLILRAQSLPIRLKHWMEGIAPQEHLEKFSDIENQVWRNWQTLFRLQGQLWEELCGLFKEATESPKSAQELKDTVLRFESSGEDGFFVRNLRQAQRFSKSLYSLQLDLWLQILFWEDQVKAQFEGSSYEILEVPDVFVKRLQSTIQRLESQSTPELIGRLKLDFSNLFGLPLKGTLLKFRTMVEEVSKSLGKKVAYRVDGDDSALSNDQTEILKDILTHLIRNSLDHGIESPEERVLERKQEQGVIRVLIQETKSHVRLSLEDDGRGIDPDRIGRIAEERGFVTREDLSRMDQESKLKLIFKPGFSTKKNANEISGRGVGMEIVEKLMIDLKGEFKVSSQFGRGTEFVLLIPRLQAA